MMKKLNIKVFLFSILLSVALVVTVFSLNGKEQTAEETGVDELAITESIEKPIEKERMDGQFDEDLDVSFLSKPYNASLEVVRNKIADLSLFGPFSSYYLQHFIR